MNDLVKNTLIVGSLLAALSMGGCSSPVATAPRSASQTDDDAWRDLISEASHLFAVIENVEGDQMTLRTLNEITAPNNRVYLLANSLVTATAFSTPPDVTRQEVCVTKVQPFNPFGDGFEQVDLVDGNSFVERHGLRCLGTVADFRGAIGVPVGTLKPETVVTIHLNGDWDLSKD